MTERQYENLRSYRHGNRSWRAGGHSRALFDKGWLAGDPRDFARITSAGQQALQTFETRHAIKPREEDYR